MSKRANWYDGYLITGCRRDYVNPQSFGVQAEGEEIMGSTLTWEPKIRNKGTLSYNMKQILKKRFGLYEGEIIHRELGLTDIPYLEGLFDAGLDEAEILINAIKEHGIILLREEVSIIAR